MALLTAVKKFLKHWMMLPLRLIIMICLFVHRKWYQFVKNRTDADDLVDLIINGEFAVQNPFYEITRQTLEDSGIKAGILESNTHLDRVNILEKVFPMDEFNKKCQALIIGPSRLALQKNVPMSVLFVKRGDSAYESKDFIKALRCYHLARCFSPPGPYGHIAAIHERRSQVLLALNDTHAADVDVKLAKYYREMDPSSEESNQIPPLIAKPQDGIPESPETQQRKEYRNKNLFSVPSEGNNHEYFPAAWKCLQLVQNDTRGKHFVTTVDLEPGTPVIVEKQYAHVLNDGLKWHFGHCFKCLEKTQTPIPCDHCVFVTYCSFKCRDDDKASHKYECSCMPYMHSLKLSRNLHLCVKAVCTAGPLVLKGMTYGHGHVEKVRNEDLSKTANCKYDAYLHILRLTSHLQATDLPLYTWLALCIVNVLEQYTDFFALKGETDNGVSEKLKLKCFVASVLIHHMVSFPHNTTSMNEQNQTRLIETSKTKKNPQQDDIPIAVGVYPTVNFLNHSCEPNTIRLQMVNGTTAIVTNRPLKKGEEILHNYGFEFLGDEREDRRSMLLQHFKFLCECIPCQLNWPTFKDLNREIQFLCPNCSIAYQDSQGALMKECVLKSSTASGVFGICQRCHKRFNLSKFRQKALLMERKLKMAQEWIESNNNLVLAILFLEESITYFQTNVCPPSIPLIVSKIALSKAFYIITAAPGDLPLPPPLTPAAISRQSFRFRPSSSSPKSPPSGRTTRLGVTRTPGKNMSGSASGYRGKGGKLVLESGGPHSSSSSDED